MEHLEEGISLPASRSFSSFHHTPLPAGQLCTRLIKILPPQQDKIPRCELWHAILPRHYQHGPKQFVDEDEYEGREEKANHDYHDDDQQALGTLIHPITREQLPMPVYSCLSYTWGEASGTVSILVNNKVCQVRLNLFIFLRTAQHTNYGDFLWIDALCIDQENVLERNHQVQQMGTIFSQAASVIIWLGLGFEIASILQIMKSAPRMGSALLYDSLSRYEVDNMAVEGPTVTDTATTPASYDAQPGLGSQNPAEGSAVNILKDSTGKMETVLGCVTSHVYWTRAWVTQEVLLARKAILMAGITTLDLQTLVSNFRAAVPYVRESAFEKIADILLQPHFARARSLRQSAVIHLMHRFPGKSCSIKRDRIYSLLALCEQGKNLEVDYNVSDKRLVQQVLSLGEHSSCFCSLAIASRALIPWDWTEDNLSGSAAWAELHMLALRLCSASCPSCENWVPFSWTRKQGHVFCMASACPDSQSHMFWESRGEPEAAGQVLVQTQRNNKSHLLCHRNDGIEFRPSQWNRVFLVRFSFRTIVELLSEDFTTHGGLNACSNLWPTVEKRPIAKEGRLSLI